MNKQSIRPSLIEWGENAKEWASNSENYRELILVSSGVYDIIYDLDDKNGWGDRKQEDGTTVYFMTREQTVEAPFHSALVTYFYFGYVVVGATLQDGRPCVDHLSFSVFCEIRDRETKEHLCQPFYLPKIQLEETPYDIECHKKAKEWAKKGMFNAIGIDCYDDFYAEHKYDYSGPVGLQGKCGNFLLF